ncbi:MAG: hypothetical protein SOT70_07675 [Lachnospiraceae bacterium]|nr:hypothetical protein [Lachnospiraceae bacterium]
MSNEEKYEKMFHSLKQYEEEIHVANQKRIKAGIKCLIFVPLIFLFLMFVTDSEKVIFLVLWIVSLFAISIYLIYVEYTDFNLQEKIAEVSNQEKEITGLIGENAEALGSNLVDTLKMLEARKDDRIEQGKAKVNEFLSGRKEKEESEDEEHS